MRTFDDVAFTLKSMTSRNAEVGPKKNINKQKKTHKKKMINPKKRHKIRSKMARFLAEPETDHQCVTPTALLEGTEDTKIKRTINA